MQETILRCPETENSRGTITPHHMGHQNGMKGSFPCLIFLNLSVILVIFIPPYRAVRPPCSIRCLTTPGPKLDSVRKFRSLYTRVSSASKSMIDYWLTTCLLDINILKTPCLMMVSADCQELCELLITVVCMIHIGCDINTYFAESCKSWHLNVVPGSHSSTIVYT